MNEAEDIRADFEALKGLAVGLRDQAVRAGFDIPGLTRPPQDTPPKQTRNTSVYPYVSVATQANGCDTAAWRWRLRLNAVGDHAKYGRARPVRAAIIGNQIADAAGGAKLGARDFSGQHALLTEDDTAAALLATVVAVFGVDAGRLWFAQLDWRRDRREDEVAP